jgi:hypothetical protein
VVVPSTPSFLDKDEKTIYQLRNRLVTYSGFFLGIERVAGFLVLRCLCKLSGGAMAEPDTYSTASTSSSSLSSTTFRPSGAINVSRIVQPNGRNGINELPRRFPASSSAFLGAGLGGAGADPPLGPKKERISGMVGKNELASSEMGRLVKFCWQ